MKTEIRLKRAFCELEKHRQTMNKFFAPVPETFQIKKGEITKDNLWRILLLNVQSRAGPSLKPSDVRELKGKFCQVIDLVEAKRLRGKDKFDYFYSKIISLHRIGPKIASVFMKDMVCKFSIFPELKEYLFLPIDTHIEKILTKKLKVFESKQVRKDNPFKSPKSKSRRFQDRLSEIHSPRVELDHFWYVGYLFCSKNSELVCNEICWIRKYCQEKNK